MGVVSASAMTAGAQELATYTDNIEALKTAIPVLNNIATQQYGVNVTAEQMQRTATMLGKVMDGQLGGLSRWGYSWTAAEEAILKNGTAMEKAATLAKVVKNSVGEMNYALAQTDVGRQKQLANTFADIKVQFGEAFTQISVLFIPALKAVADALAVVANWARQAAQYISMLFGKQIKQETQNVYGVADAYGDVGDAAVEAGDDVAKGAKKAKGAMFGFDEVNNIQLPDAGGADDSSGVADIGGGFGGYDSLFEDDGGSSESSFLAGIKAQIDAVKETLKPTVDALKDLWEALKPLGSFIAKGLQDFYNNFLKPVGMWFLGDEGLPKLIRILTEFIKSIDLDKISAAFARLWSALAVFAQAVGEGLINFFERFLVPVGTWVANEAIPRFLNALSAGLEAIDWDNINEKLKAFWDALAAFTINVGEGLLWLWENILVPLGTWTVNEVVPRFIEHFTIALDAINGVIEALKPLFQWFWDSFLKPLADWTGGVLLEVWDAQLAHLRTFSEWIKNNKKAVETIAIIVGSFATAIGLVTAAVTAWNLVGVIATGVTTAFGVAVNVLTSPITLVILAIGAIIAAIVLLVRNWDWVKETAANVWESIKNWWGGVADWFDTKVIQPVIGFFTGLWEGLQDGFVAAADFIKDTFDKLVNIVKIPINFIIDIINGMISGVVSGINTIIRAVNSIHFTVPDWVPGIGGKGVGFNLTEIVAPRIPKLAKGGIVDRATLAMIGENGKEAVMPLENNTSWVTDIANQLGMVLAANSGGSSGNSNGGTAIFNVNGRELAEATIEDFQSVAKRRGMQIRPV